MVSDRHYGTPASDVQALFLLMHRSANLRATIAVVSMITDKSSSRRDSVRLDNRWMQEYTASIDALVCDDSVRQAVG